MKNYTLLFSFYDFELNTNYIDNLTNEQKILIKILFIEIFCLMANTDEFVNNYYDYDTHTYNCMDYTIYDY